MEEGGEGAGGRRDPGPRSPPPGCLSRRDREEGRRRLRAAVSPRGRGHRGRLEDKKEEESEKTNMVIFSVNYIFSVETNQGEVYRGLQRKLKK